MVRVIDVYLQSDLVGHLVQDDGGQICFDYAERCLNKPGATSLSQSLPLRNTRFKRKECRGYFAGILPEESKREVIAGNLGITARNDCSMLERIGGECAGAVTFMPAGQPLTENHNRELYQKALVAILKELPKRPLLAGREGVRLTSSGVAPANRDGCRYMR